MGICWSGSGKLSFLFLFSSLYLRFYIFIYFIIHLVSNFFVFVYSFYILIYLFIQLTFCGPKSNKKPSLLQKLYGWLYQIRIALAAPAELVCCANSNSPRLLLQVLFDRKSASYFWKVAASLKFVLWLFLSKNSNVTVSFK